MTNQFLFFPQNVGITISSQVWFASYFDFVTIVQSCYVKVNRLEPGNHDTCCLLENNKTTGHNIKWDNFDILASGKTDYHFKMKQTLFIYELKPALNVNVGSEKLLLY